MRIITAATLAVSLLGLTACAKPWKESTYPTWGFAASFRVPPTVKDTPPSAKEGTPHMFQVEAVQDGRDLVVAVSDTTNTDKTDQQILTDIPQAMVQSADGTVKAHSNVTLGKVVGRELTIDRGNNPTERARVFVANKKVYQVITQSPQGSDDPEALKFLNSFRLLP